MNSFSPLPLPSIFSGLNEEADRSTELAMPMDSPVSELEEMDSEEVAELFVEPVVGLAPFLNEIKIFNNDHSRFFYVKDAKQGGAIATELTQSYETFQHQHKGNIMGLHFVDGTVNKNPCVFLYITEAPSKKNKIRHDRYFNGNVFKDFKKFLRTEKSTTSFATTAGIFASSTQSNLKHKQSINALILPAASLIKR